MRLLLFSQYFFPETGATSNRVYYLAKHLLEEGHEVRIISEKPNHPKGIFFDGYEKGIFIDTEFKGIPTTYCWVYTKPNKSFIDRVLFYISYMIMSVVAAVRCRGKYDVVIGTSPPLFVGISAWLSAKLKGARFVLDVRDLWPDVAVAMGELTNTFIVRISKKIELFLYRNAQLITAVTESFKKTIYEQGINPDKISVIKNGTDIDVFDLDSSVKSLRDKLKLRDAFIVSYVGNLGLAQGLKHVIESAKILHDRGCSDVEFLFVGEGPKKKELIQLSESYQLSNISFVPRVPLEVAAQYMQASDTLLVPLANDSIYSQFIPSKLFDSMAASKPILLSVDGESRQIVKKAGAGLYYEAENAEQLTEKIMQLKNNPAEAIEMGRRGYLYARNNLSRYKQSMKMHQELIKLTLKSSIIS